MASYIVQPGDSLSAIAAANGTTVAAILGLNPSITDPNLIFAGATITIPDAPAPVSTAPAPTTTPIGGAVNPPDQPNLTPSPVITGGVSPAEAAAVVDHFISTGQIDAADRETLIQNGTQFATMAEFAEFLNQNIVTTAPTGTTPSDGPTPTPTNTPAGVSPVGTGGAVVRIDFMTEEGLASVPVFFPASVWQALLASPLAGLYGLDRTEPVIPVGQLANFKRDAGNILTGGLLEVFNGKVDALDAAGAPGVTDLPPVSPEMAASGIAWAIDPVTGRPELIDTKPFFGPPISSFQFVPTDPNNPSAGGTWNVVQDPSDIKNIYEGVPSSVRPWLQLALDAGGDTSVVPDGAARAWVSFILAQVNGSSRRPPTELPFGVGLPEFEGGQPGASIVEPDPSIFPIGGGVPPAVIVPPEGTIPPAGTPIPPASDGGTGASGGDTTTTTTTTGGDVGGDTGGDTGGAVVAPVVTTPVPPPDIIVTDPAQFPPTFDPNAPVAPIVPPIQTEPSVIAPLPGETAPSFPLPPPDPVVAPAPAPTTFVPLPEDPLFDPATVIAPAPAPAPTAPVVAPAPVQDPLQFPAETTPVTTVVQPAPVAEPTTSTTITSAQILENEINALQILIDAGAPAIVIANQQQQVDDLLGFSSINVA